MAEYIKKEDIEQKIQDGLNNLVLGHDAIEVLGMIYEMPAEDVAPVRHGRWKLLVSGNGVCSACHFTSVHVWDFDSSLSYCPHCGAKMDGDG